MGDVDGGIGPVSDETIVALAESAEVYKQLVVSYTLFENRWGVRSCGNCGEEIVHDEIQETCPQCHVPWTFTAVTHNFLTLEEGASLYRGSHLVFIGEGTRSWGVDVPLIPAKP